MYRMQFSSAVSSSVLLRHSKSLSGSVYLYASKSQNGMRNFHQDRLTIFTVFSAEIILSRSFFFFFPSSFCFGDQIR